uniref:Uncharacterized protein n=1 Tax=Escherichia coli TaxID=562 RepID=A0A7U1E1X5_ECOLX|nr:hypothetical protein [Escherichia coli]
MTDNDVILTLQIKKLTEFSLTYKFDWHLAREQETNCKNKQ